jgi:hypothetical protein
LAGKISTLLITASPDIAGIIKTKECKRERKITAEDADY